MFSAVIQPRRIVFFAILAWSASASADTSIRHRLSMGNEFFVRSVVFSPKSESFAVACGSDGDPGEIRLYSTKEGKRIAVMKGHVGRINCLAFSPDGRLLVSGGHDQRCRIWDLTTHDVVGELKGHTDEIVGLSFNPDGMQVASSSKDKTVILWDVQSQKKVATLDSQKEMTGPIVHSPNGKLLVGGGTEGTIRVWDLSTKKEASQRKGHMKGVASLAFTPNGEEFASCGDDGIVKLWKVWDAYRWTETLTWDQGRNERALSLAVSPNGQLLAVASWAGEVVFYDISRRVRAMILKRDLVKTRVAFWAHELPVTTVAFRPDGKMLASGSLDATVKIWVDLPEFK